MRISNSYNQSSYMRKMGLYAGTKNGQSAGYAVGNGTANSDRQSSLKQAAAGSGRAGKASDLRQQLRGLQNENASVALTQRKNAYLPNANKAQSIVKSMQDYADKLKADREKAKELQNSQKQLKYQYSHISAQVIRSKTSMSAKEAARQAKREVLKLRKEKASGEYDPEEMEAALAHAKAIERVAKKKVKHLEEEEMAKAAGGPCADREVEEEEKLSEDDNRLSEDEITDEDEMSEEALEQELAEYGYLDQTDYALGTSADVQDIFADMSMEDLDIDQDMVDLYAGISDQLDAMDEMMTEVSEMTSDMYDELEQGMKDMLEEMGLGEATASAKALQGDMDPADLKEMKMKHRQKEMKEIVKADADYLKAIFKHFQDMKSGGGSGAGAAKSPSASPAGVISAVSTAPAVHVPDAVSSSPAADAPMSEGGGFDVSV